MSEEETVRIAVAQMNPIVGDLAGNAARIIKFYEKAAADAADLVVFPELALVGYPPEDLVLMPTFQDRALLALQEISGKTIHGPAMLLGTIWEEKGALYNAAILIENGNILHIERKVNLPNTGIFDEQRVFDAGKHASICNWRGINMGILICEDVWSQTLPQQLAEQECELVIVLNASPFEADKMSQRRGVCNLATKRIMTPLIYVNLVGGQDDVVYDGGSFALTANSMSVMQMPQFNEALGMVEVTHKDKRWQIASDTDVPLLTHEESLWHALTLGLHDYVGKNGFEGVLLGLSGGIDSALSAAIAVDALGADCVKGVLMPSPHSSDHSVVDAKESARLLGIETMMIPIGSTMDAFHTTLTPIFGSDDWISDVMVGGNLQARLRGTTLMAISNQSGYMLLSTGNKSELAVGYSTLYGDSCGGYNVLKDVYKTQVYHLAQWRNMQDSVVPVSSITKAPSAELAPGQLDEDQLPAYEVLDAILVRFIEQRMSAEDIVADGYELELVNKILRMVRLSEYKRRQSCPGVKVTPMAFGKDRRYPITNKF